jgi:hypothetical protein
MSKGCSVFYSNSLISECTSQKDESGEMRLNRSVLLGCNVLRTFRMGERGRGRPSTSQPLPQPYLQLKHCYDKVVSSGTINAKIGQSLLVSADSCDNVSERAQRGRLGA